MEGKLVGAVGLTLSPDNTKILNGFFKPAAHNEHKGNTNPVQQYLGRLQQ
jgi:hypothetical protein